MSDTAAAADDKWTGFWTARLSNGLTVHEFSPWLKRPGLSPWRSLEAYVAENALRVVWAQVTVGSNYGRMTSNGCPLTCGQVLHHRRELTGGGARTVVYHWARREEPERSVWLLVDADRCWTFETPHDCDMAPDPEAA